MLGKKLGSARVYDASGALIPVTVVLAGPNRVLQVKTQAGKDGYNAVQLGFDDQKEQRITKPRSDTSSNTARSTRRRRKRRATRATRPRLLA